MPLNWPESNQYQIEAKEWIGLTQNEEDTIKVINSMLKKADNDKTILWLMTDTKKDIISKVNIIDDVNGIEKKDNPVILQQRIAKFIFALIRRPGIKVISGNVNRTYELDNWESVSILFNPAFPTLKWDVDTEQLEKNLRNWTNSERSVHVTDKEWNEIKRFKKS